MDSRNERVLIETDRYRIVGDLTLPRDGYRSRMTDFLNAAERDFIVLAMPIDGGAGRRSDAVGGTSVPPPGAE